MDKALGQRMDYTARRLKHIIALGGRCELCSCGSFTQLEVHHIHGGGRRARIEAGGGSSWNRRRSTEALELLCVPCHAKTTKADEVSLTPRRACNLLSEALGETITYDGLYELVEAGKIAGAPVAGGRRDHRFEFKAQAILEYARAEMDAAKGKKKP
jgi:hypothetical protein